MMTMAFCVRNLSAYFGDFCALKHVSMDIPLRAMTAIIGPSGCGKSTFIRCLNRLHEEVPGGKAFGEVFFEGQNLFGPYTDVVLLRQKIGMVFQKPNPFPSMSIIDNVTIGPKRAGLNTRSELKILAEECLRKAALWDEVKDKLHQDASGLSGGQQQRLCIARAIAMKPTVLLMDEPTSALDPIATAKIEELMVELKKDFTIVVVTHNMQQARRVSDQTAFFVLGELIEFTSTKKFFESPRKDKSKAYVSGQFG